MWLILSVKFYTFQQKKEFQWRTRVRNHARCAGIFAKTDKLDARVIAHFASCHPPRLYRLKSPIFQELRGLNHRKDQLVGLRSQEKARLDKVSDPYILRSINRMIRNFTKEIDKIDAKMEKLWSQDEEWQEKRRCLQTCKGIGKRTAETVLLECPELGTMSPKEVASLAGLAPVENGDHKAASDRQGYPRITGFGWGRACCKGSTRTRGGGSKLRSWGRAWQGELCLEEEMSGF